MSEKHLFISFSQEDSSLVQELARLLRDRAGLDVWYYQEQTVGIEYVTRLMHAIEQARAVLLVLSQASAHSVFVLNEILHTRKQRIRIIPIYVEACSGPVCVLVNHLHRIQMRDGQDVLPLILEALELPVLFGTDFPVGELAVVDAYQQWSWPTTICYLEVPDHMAPLELPTEIGRWNIGRLPVSANHIAINQGFVSRSHAYIRVRLEENGVSFVVYDESSYGTYVNGERISIAQVLNEGDEIGLGQPDAMLRFAYSLETRAPQANFGL